MSTEQKRAGGPGDSEQTAQTLDEALSANRDHESVVDVDEPTQQLVLFTINGQRFALPGSAVSEILPSDQPVYYVPGLPVSTEGVLHLRGNIESIIRLHSLLGLAAPVDTTAGMILLVNGAGLRSGVRIEHLDDVCDVIQSLLLPPPESLASSLRPYVSALWQIDETQALAVLDPDAIFSAYQQGLG